MSKDGLNRTQVGAILHHMRGATVAQHVRTGIASHARGCSPNHLPDALASQLARTATEEQKWRSALSRQLGPRMLHVLGQHFLRRFSQRHDPFFIALAPHQYTSEIQL